MYHIVRSSVLSSQFLTKFFFVFFHVALAIATFIKFLVIYCFHFSNEIFLLALFVVVFSSLFRYITLNNICYAFSFQLVVNLTTTSTTALRKSSQTSVLFLKIVIAIMDQATGSPNLATKWRKYWSRS